MVASVDEVASESDYNYESSQRRGWMESSGEMSRSLRIHVVTEASAYDAYENWHHNQWTPNQPSRIRYARAYTPSGRSSENISVLLCEISVPLW